MTNELFDIKISGAIMTPKDRENKTVLMSQKILEATLPVIRTGKKYESLYFWQRKKEIRKELYDLSLALEKAIQEASQWCEHCAFEGVEKRNLAASLNVCEYMYLRYADLKLTRKYGR